MVATLILLYALDTGNIPIGCYAAAWTLSILQVSADIVKIAIKIKKRK